MKISKYGNVSYGNVFENHYHMLAFKYGYKKNQWGGVLYVETRAKRLFVIVPFELSQLENFCVGNNYTPLSRKKMRESLPKEPR